MIGGSSSIWRENTFRKRTPAHFGFQNGQNSAIHAQKPREDAYAPQKLAQNRIAGPNQCRTECFRSAMRPRIRFKRRRSENLFVFDLTFCPKGLFTTPGP
jgi:hypothetical protein